MEIIDFGNSTDAATMLKNPMIISAIGTPIDKEEDLHNEGLEQHLADQWSAGIDGILVGGTMGSMQMLRDKTYASLVQRASELSATKGEVLVGVGDAGWSRTRDRIELVSRFPVDGVVVLTPYLFRFTQQQLVEYFTTLADESPLPVFLYDLPSLTGVPIHMETYEAIANHPNIRGAKVSGRLEIARELIKRMDRSFRVVVAEPDKVATLLREGVGDHLDGMFAIAPNWVMRIVRAAGDGDWATADLYQAKLNTLHNALIAMPFVMPAFTAIMNARSIPGSFHGAPYRALSIQDRKALLSMDILNELIYSPCDARPI